MSDFTIIPAIDLKDGVCVRLVQGRKDEVTVYGDDPVAVAREFQRQGARRLHVIDLDGAFDGRPRNADKLLDVVRAVDIPVQTGGGIRSARAAAELLQEGVDRVIFGTVAVKSPDVVRAACEAHGPRRVLVGIDARDGLAAVEGWTEQSQRRAFDFAVEMKASGIEEIVYTDIARDGMLTGPNLEQLEHMLGTGLKIVASGGVASIDDIQAVAAFAERGVTGIIVGKAVYTGDVDLEHAISTVEKG